MEMTRTNNTGDISRQTCDRFLVLFGLTKEVPLGFTLAPVMKWFRVLLIDFELVSQRACCLRKHVSPYNPWEALFKFNVLHLRNQGTHEHLVLTQVSR